LNKKTQGELCFLG